MDKPTHQARMLRNVTLKLKARTITFPRGSVISLPEEDEEGYYCICPRDPECQDFDYICFNKMPNEAKFGFRIEEYKEN